MKEARKNSGQSITMNDHGIVNDWNDPRLRQPAGDGVSIMYNQAGFTRDSRGNHASSREISTNDRNPSDGRSGGPRTDDDHGMPGSPDGAGLPMPAGEAVHGDDPHTLPAGPPGKPVPDPAALAEDLLALEVPAGFLNADEPRTDKIAWLVARRLKRYDVDDLAVLAPAVNRFADRYGFDKDYFFHTVAYLHDEKVKFPEGVAPKYMAAVAKARATPLPLFPRYSDLYVWVGSLAYYLSDHAACDFLLPVSRLAAEAEVHVKAISRVNQLLTARELIECVPQKDKKSGELKPWNWSAKKAKVYRWTGPLFRDPSPPAPAPEPPRPAYTPEKSTLSKLKDIE